MKQPPRRRRLVVGEDMVYIPREDRNWTPDTPIKRMRTAGQARVTATQLRLRKEPVTGDTVATLPQNAIVDAGPSNVAGWAYVEWNGNYGYASNEYLEPVGGPDWDPKPIPPPQPSPTPPAPPAPTPPAPPAPEAASVFAKVAIALAVVAVVTVPTYMLLKPSH